MIHARATGEGPDRLDRIVVGAVHDVRGAHALRHLQLSVEHVHADDLAGAADARALHDRKSHAATAEHGDRLPGREARGAQRRADAGKDTATDERGAIERKRGVDLHERVFVQQHVIGIARDARELAERPPLL